MAKKETVIRTVLLITALINQVLTSAGKSILPLDDETLTQCISIVFTIITSIWAWWKNNSFSTNALKADEYLKDLRRDNE